MPQEYEMRHGQVTSLKIFAWCLCALPYVGMIGIIKYVAVERGILPAMGVFIICAILSSLGVYLLTLRRKD